MSETEGRPTPRGGPIAPNGICPLCHYALDDHVLRDPNSRQWLDRPVCRPKTAKPR